MQSLSISKAYGRRNIGSGSGMRCANLVRRHLRHLERVYASEPVKRGLTGMNVIMKATLTCPACGCCKTAIKTPINNPKSVLPIRIAQGKRWRFLAESRSIIFCLHYVLSEPLTSAGCCRQNLFSPGCFDGQGTSAYEQKTQQSPALGFNVAWQLIQR